MTYKVLSGTLSLYLFLNVASSAVCILPCMQRCCPRDNVFFSRRLEDKNQTFGFGLGLETESLRTLKTFASVITYQSVLHFLVQLMCLRELFVLIE